MSFDSFFAALTQQESGGNFGAVNGRTGALGAYQILPSNIRPWSRQYLGYEVSPTQFLNSPSLQTKLARAVLSAQFNRYGAAGAASWWYSGSASNVGSTRSSYGEPSVAEYVQQVLARMNKDYGGGGPPTGTNRFSTVDKRVQSTALEDLLKPKPQAAPGPAGLAGVDRSGALGLGEVETGLGLNAPDAGLGADAPDGNPAAVLGESPTPTPTEDLVAPPIGDVGKWFNPTGGAKQTSAYGMRNGRMHTGVDFAMAMRTPLRSMGAGVVKFVGNRGGKGKTVVIRYADGTESIYAHMDGFSASVGQRVGAGDLVGWSGNSGHSTGPHLHLEIMLPNGTTVDPVAWMKSMGL